MTKTFEEFLLSISRDIGQTNTCELRKNHNLEINYFKDKVRKTIDELSDSGIKQIDSQILLNELKL